MSLLQPLLYWTPECMTVSSNVDSGRSISFVHSSPSPLASAAAAECQVYVCGYDPGGGGLSLNINTVCSSCVVHNLCWEQQLADHFNQVPLTSYLVITGLKCLTFLCNGNISENLSRDTTSEGSQPYLVVSLVITIQSNESHVLTYMNLAIYT